MIHDLHAQRAGALAQRTFAMLLERRSGQRIGANRAWRMDTALAPVLREHGLADLDTLAGRVAAGGDPMLEDRVLDALLNGETSFFRDAGVLEQAAELVAARTRASGRRPRIWSAGCSTGQEPLSLAMLFAEGDLCADPAGPDIRATDVSPLAIARGRAGRFSQFEIQRGLPVRRMLRWFDADSDAGWIARPELLARVAFRVHNLVAEPPPPGRFDLVLCRNLLFYLAPPLRRQVFAAIADALRPDGLLMLGAGETVIGQTDRFVPSAEHRGFYVPVCAGGCV